MPQSTKPEATKTSPFLNLRIQREEKAAQHTEIMLAKYGDSDDGYSNWHDEHYQFEYPLPYGDRYFYRFVEVFFGGNSDSSLLYNLHNAFNGDEVDSDYIEELFTRAERLGLFTNGVTIVFHSSYNSVMTMVWGPDKQVDPEYSSTRNTYYGGKTNRERRKRIRRWLETRAKELGSLFSVQAPLVMEAVTPTAMLSQPAVLLLDSICVGKTTLLRKQEADRVRAAWEDAKTIALDESEYPAIGTAVYKVAKLLGMIEEKVSPERWQAILQAEWQLSITEGIGKYNLKGKPNKLFKKAVQRAYEFFSHKYPGKTKSIQLPSNYQ